MDIAGIIRAGIGETPFCTRAELEAKCQEAYRAAVAAERDRFREGMEAPGIAGDGDHMVAVLELLAAHPDMPGEAAADFVSRHMAGAPVNAEAYEALRTAAAGAPVFGLAMPSSRKAGETGWGKVVADLNESRAKADGAAPEGEPARGGKWDRFVQ